ncbi:MAG: helix-turn-helix domain-containing protein [Dehalococcoidia bacterium]
MVAKPVVAPDLRELRAALGLSRERMARLFDVSAKTIERWEASGQLPPGRSARNLLVKLAEIVHLGLIVYTPEGFVIFMSTPLGEFHGRTALQLIELGEAEDVLGALAGDYEGLGF